MKSSKGSCKNSLKCCKKNIWDNFENKIGLSIIV